MYLLRTATSKDQKELEKLYEGFVHAMRQYDEEDMDTQEEIQQWISHSLNHPQGMLLVVEKEKEILGFARLQHKRGMDEKNNQTISYVKIHDLYVEPSMRKQGIAKQLIDASIQWAKMQNCKEVILNVYTQNKIAQKLYMDKNFVEDAALSNHRIRMKYSFIHNEK